MSAKDLIMDTERQADITAYLLELLDDEELRQAAWLAGAETDSPLTAIDTYREKLKQRLREGK